MAPTTSCNPSGRELAHLFGEIVGRTTKALNIVLLKKTTAAASRLEAEAEESLRSAIPLLPDFEDLLCRQFTSPSSYHRWSRQTKVFSNMAAQEQVCCGALPAVDQDLAALIRSPGSLFGGPACLNKDSKAMKSLLGKLHRSMAMQARLANTAAILTLYTNHLSGLMQNQPVDASLVREFQSSTVCLASVSKDRSYSQQIGTASSGCQWSQSQSHGPYGSNGTDSVGLCPQSPTHAKDILLFLQMQLEARKSAVTLRGMLLKVLSDFHLSQSMELQSLPVSAADQLAFCPEDKHHALSVHRDCCTFSPEGSKVVLRPNPAFLLKVLSDFHLSQSMELQSLPVSAADQLAFCP
ncbi:unnamed protein product, partial [Gadus morhua 'NCC']